jgi:hypothetical protein
MEKEQLMKSESCFQCKKQGHLSQNCPKRSETTAQEVTIKEAPKLSKQKSEKKKKDEPSSYDSLLKQINACFMEDRQKIMKAFSTAGSDYEEQDF